MIIYKITNTVTGKFYVGQTVMSIKRRWAVHKASKRIMEFLPKEEKEIAIDHIKAHIEILRDRKAA